MGKLHVQLSKLNSTTSEKSGRNGESSEALQFNRLYNAFHRVVKENANEAVERSAERYIKAIEGKLFHT